MDAVKVTEAKSHFSAILQRVENGEEIAIARRGKIIARLIPEKKSQMSTAEALAAVWYAGGLDLAPITELEATALDPIHLD